jgi:hypothetical protein
LDALDSELLEEDKLLDDLEALEPELEDSDEGESEDDEDSELLELSEDLDASD